MEMRIKSEREMDIDSGQKCVRADNFVNWLYGESDEDESRSFQQHLQTCRQCSKDAQALRSVRQSVAMWRDASLGALPSQPTARATVRRRSASAAISEFFALSPFWMKGAVGFASVLFCILAVLAVMKIRETPQVITLVSPGKSEQEISALVEERAQQRFRELEANLNKSVASQRPGNSQVVKASSAGPRTPRTAVAKLPARRRQPLSREERLQLAADLRLIDEPEQVELELISDQLSRQDD
jgi:hypothetical protein